MCKPFCNYFAYYYDRLVSQLGDKHRGSSLQRQLSLIVMIELAIRKEMEIHIISLFNVNWVT